MDLKSVIGNFAPTLAAMIGGPLAGSAVSALAAAFGLAPDAKLDDITRMVEKGAITPDMVVAARAADNDFKLKMEGMKVDLEKVNIAAATALDVNTIADVADARRAGQGNIMVMWIAVFILLSFLLAMGIVLLGCWAVMTGAVSFTPAQSGMFAAVTGLVGSIVGYFASNAQTCINYLYGGSLGGRKNADGLNASVQQMGVALGKAANIPTTVVAPTVVAPAAAP